MHLAWSEIKRNRSRFLLIVAIISLITALVLFVSALAEGLGSGNIEGLAKLDADLLVFQDRSRLSLAASSLPWERLRHVKRVEGVAAVGAVGYTSATIPGEQTLNGFALDVALLGIQPGQPGDPPVVDGRRLRTERENGVVIDRKTQQRTGLRAGDDITIRTVQDATDQYYTLPVVGVTDDRQFSLRPSVFVPLRTWDRLRPGTLVGAESRELILSVLALRSEPGVDSNDLKGRIEAEVSDVEVADLKTAWEATPGYKEQQSTLSLQQGFTWFIGLLVIGVFFQIITLQKVGQVGVLKAMGAPNRVIITSALAQIVMITAAGVLLGGLGALSLARGIPVSVPLSWPLERVIFTLLSLLVLGPIGGLVSLRILLKVEPLTALGLAK